ACLRVYDPVAMDNFRQAVGGCDPNLVFCSSPLEASDGSHALLILTDWEEFRHLNWNLVKSRMASPIIIDGRNLLDPNTLKEAGFDYYGVGRAALATTYKR
ncbi:MAG: UDP-glucose/GDP-mannose dehydrogenase family protein, partial [Armatimonadetes bacterium]|nr:UDP-glucose/GDP-mannose dehydrogenase family protein [Armatimonadota bacterium]